MYMGKLQFVSVLFVHQQIAHLCRKHCDSASNQEGAVAPHASEGPVRHEACVCELSEQRWLPYVYRLMYQRMFEWISNISLGGISLLNVLDEMIPPCRSFWCNEGEL